MQNLTKCPVCVPRGTRGLLRLEGPMNVAPYRPPWWAGREPLTRLVPVGTVTCAGCNGTGLVVKED